MKKLEKRNFESMPSKWLTEDMAKKLNDLIDLVNSQQEAIEKLENRHTGEYCEVCNTTGHKPADDKPDTHRTVTLRIPKGMKLSLAIYLAFKNDEAYHKVSLLDWLLDQSDTDLQKALDEVQPNE